MQRINVLKIEPKFTWLEGSWAIKKPDLLQACSDLYSKHYGVWSSNNTKLPTERIRLSPDRIKKWLALPGAKIYYAKLDNRLIGYSIATIEKAKNYGLIAWVTQLVVHKEYRHKGIGKNLLFSIWRFSNNFAWGILTSSPYAIRALEKATRRRCVPKRIKKNSRMLINFGIKNVSYLGEGMDIKISDADAMVNTCFYADHSQLDEMIKNVTSEKTPWLFSQLDEGWEWIAFTFKDQEQLELTTLEVEEMLNTSDQVTRQAYSRMQLDNAHKWTKHTHTEVNFIIDSCVLSDNATIADFGCGKGRHAIMLAKKGYGVIGIDYSDNLINKAIRDAKKYDINNVHFVKGDCRSINLEKKFDVLISLYDVIGTYVHYSDNMKIVQNLYDHLRDDGLALISVMNYELTKHNATRCFSLQKNANELLELPASNIMEQTGDVFNPEYYMIDIESDIVYRKEQFSEGKLLPEEFIVRDKRFTMKEITDMCTKVGFAVLWAKYVSAGEWDKSLSPYHANAKEILLLCNKI